MSRPTAQELGEQTRAAYDARQLGTALRLSKRAALIAPTDPIAHMNVALMFSAMGRHEEAAQAIERATALDPVNPEIGHNRAHIELSRGNWAVGWRYLEARLQLPHMRQFAFTNQPPPLWQGQSISGRRLLVRWEEGFGDTLQMLRYIPRLQQNGAAVILDVQEPLVELAASTEATVHATRTGAPINVDADFWTPLHSLPRLCGECLAEPAPPYLTADETMRQAWCERLAALPRPLIAVQWRGADHYPKNAVRSIAAPRLFQTLVGIGGTLISLQIDRRPDEPLPPGVLEPKPSFPETAALMTVCDAVVTVDTAMAHLAGALGCPVHILLAQDADWRWQSPNAANWYAHAVLHRQVRQDDWAGALASLRRALSARKR